MKRSAKAVGVILGVAVVGIAFWFVTQKNVVRAASVSPSVPSAMVCRPVHGVINSTFTTQNCTSPVGLCTTGAITGSGILDGPTTFTALAVAPSAGLSPVEPAANLSYSGQLTITASHGTMTTDDLGVLDASHLAFSEMERPASGTGIFANPTNSVFFISGALVDNGQGFQGDLSGTICFGSN
jgi:hypothetical protein